ncbi:hypothetical protein [Tenacibaculum jejuense]|uniref:Uncharacterized protein n=1 Tax=Tenacibaculum jejuense TaxID=584609 RepID=A0A238U8G7_9FLAO|nr:hypothetical protein [Tenacibaculum jejuense]SNR15481.1 protein of unknown function [Tenacibaculum jejuense]
MKKSFFLMLCFVSISLLSQNKLGSSGRYKLGALHLKNGTVLTGEIKIIKHHRIVLKKEDEKKGFDHTLVKSIVFNDSTKYHYKKSDKVNLLLKKEVSGPVELYSLASYFAGFSDGSMASMSMHYYLGKEGNDLIDKVPRNIEGRRFRKFISKYASNCEKLLEKVQSKKSIRSNFDSNIIKIIHFFNTNCNNKTNNK